MIIRSKLAYVMGEAMFQEVEDVIVKDSKLLFTQLSLLSVLFAFVNMVFFKSVVLGIAASLVYFLINTIFLGNAFLEKEAALSRCVLGSFLLIAFLGLISLVVMMIYNLDAIRSAIVLCIVTTLSSFLSKMTKYSLSIELDANRSHA